MIKTLFLLTVLTISALVVIFIFLLSPADQKNKNTIPVNINKGDSVSIISKKLENVDLIKNSLAFKIYVKISQNTSNLQAGNYNFSPSQSVAEIVNDLSVGKTEDIKITIIEGLRREEIANNIDKVLNKNTKTEFLVRTEDLEGKLFPDTYLVKKDTTAKEIIKKMTDNFEEKFNSVTKDATTTLNKEEILILASIIERETKLNEDRPLVAGILYKRFINGWPLEADATVQYIIGYTPLENSWWKKILTKDDLEIESPYNTRKNPGFPPKPICNPSLASLEAASHPQKSSYWFYLSDTKGNMHYSSTLEAHKANIEKYIDK